MERKTLRLNFSVLGFVSIALFIIVQIFNTYQGNANEMTFDYTVLKWTRSMTLYSGILVAIPTLEFMIKAYYKHYLKQEYKISTISFVLTILSFGMPLFSYAFTSLMAKVLFNSEEQNDIEIWGFVILSLITVGLIWIGFFLSIGVTAFVYKRGFKGVIEFNTDQVLVNVSLLITSIITLGLIWIIIGISLITTRIFVAWSHKNVLGVNLPIEQPYVVGAIIISVLTLGIFPLVILAGYWQFELFFMNIDQKEISYNL